MNINYICSVDSVIRDVPMQLWELSTNDGRAGQGPEIVKLFHNKFFVYPSNFFDCYLSYLFPRYVYQNFSIIGLILFFLGIYFLVINKNIRILFLLLFAPVIMMLFFPSIYFTLIYVLIMVYGLVYSIINLKKYVQK